MTSRHTRSTTLLTALAVAASWACSSPTESNTSPNGGAGASSSAGGANAGGPSAGSAGLGGTGSNGGAAGASANAGGDSGGAATMGGAAPSSTKTGQVALYNLLPQNHVTMSASFVQGRTPGTKTCDSTTMGSCSASICPDDLGGSQQLASAGVITVTSADLMGSAVLNPGADASYALPVSTFAHVFSGQEHVTFSAAGDTVPAFASELDMPLVLLLSEPLFVKGAAGIDVPRDHDLSLVWTRGVEGGLLYVSGGSARPDGLPGSVGLNCQFPAAPGSGSISATLLQKLGPDTLLTLFTTASKVVQAGDYAVTLATVNGVANPDKAVVPNIRVQ